MLQWAPDVTTRMYATFQFFIEIFQGVLNILRILTYVA